MASLHACLVALVAVLPEIVLPTHFTSGPQLASAQQIQEIEAFNLHASGYCKVI
jgi:hypothetical protein